MSAAIRSVFLPLLNLHNLALVLAFIGFALSSPRLVIGLAPWLATSCLLRYVRQVRWWKAILFGQLCMWIAGIYAGWGVVPFPLPVLIVMSFVSSFLFLLPYLLDKWLSLRLTGLVGTLVFPVAGVTVEYLAAQSGGGSWGHIAYLQFSYSWLIQLASVTGIWGISFLIYWFASILNHAISAYERQKPFVSIVRTYAICVALVLLFGFLRLQLSPSGGERQLSLAGITAENLSMLQSIHLAETGEQIHISPEAAQGDPTLARAFASMIAFVERPDDPKFKPVYQEIDKLMEQLWQQSEKAVTQGAKLISWTEGIVAAIKDQENTYIQQAQEFAQEHQIWFLFPMASIHPGKVVPGQPFIENKVLTINPQGEIVNTYFKNIPVGGVEPCFPGDGTIPVISTQFGHISPVICYDADFPGLIRQVGKQATELLIIPSGDWKAISPIHSYMAVMRGIENGVSVFRPVSKGMMIAADPYGRVLASDDYFSDHEHVMQIDLSLYKIETLYTRIGDSFAFICILGTLGLVITGILIRKRKQMVKTENSNKVVHQL